MATFYLLEPSGDTRSAGGPVAPTLLRSLGLVACVTLLDAVGAAASRTAGRGLRFVAIVAATAPPREPEGHARLSDNNRTTTSLVLKR